jgi:glycosyltransferase involved in cell wall biosynthesis
MKSILFDLFNSQPTGTSKFHGGGEYIKTIFEYLVTNYSNMVQFIVFYNDKNFLDDWIKELIRNYSIKVYFFHDISEVQSIFKQEKIDIFYSGLPYLYSKSWFPENVKIIGTIHGLRPIEMPHDVFEYKYLTGKERLKCKIRLIKWKILGSKKSYKQKYLDAFKPSIMLLDKMICDSEHSKYSVMINYPELKEKCINVFYPPRKFVKETKINSSCIVEGKFVLLLGGDRWLKNAYRGLKAMDNLYAKQYLNDYKTVLVGNISDNIKKDLINIDKFVFLDYLKSEELESLYQSCDIFVYPSLNEGFGYPPLEVMRYGKTCVISGVCSLPEICGQAVYYVNPYDIEEIENRILHASQVKLDKHQVISQSDKIGARQTDDLKKLCDLIVGGK